MVAQQLSRDNDVVAGPGFVQTTKSLDQRYIEFRDRTARIFAEMPQLEPMRHFIFKDLLIQRRADKGVEIIKHWLRPLRRRSESKGTVTQADVLICGETRREVQVDALLPVYRRLVGRGIKVQLAWSAGPSNLPATTLLVRYPARAVAPAWVKDAWEALCDKMEELQDPSLEQTFSYACANNQALIDEVNRVLEIVQPKVVLAAATQLPAGAAFITCSRSRALTLLLQHGILQPVYTPLLSDYMLTWGQSSNGVMINLGIPEEKLVALGSPRHDSMRASTEGDASRELCEALSLPLRPTFVFFSNGNDLVRNGIAPIECAEWLESMAYRFEGDINVVVRLHPNEDGSLYRHCSHLTISKTLPDFRTTLQGSNWVGSLCSTVLYDALLYHKPTYQFYANGWPELAINWKSGLAKRISSRMELEQMVDHALRDRDSECVESNLIDDVFANHGRATEGVAEFLQDRLEERRS